MHVKVQVSELLAKHEGKDSNGDKGNGNDHDGDEHDDDDNGHGDKSSGGLGQQAPPPGQTPAPARAPVPAPPPASGSGPAPPPAQATNLHSPEASLSSSLDPSPFTTNLAQTTTTMQSSAVTSSHAVASAGPIPPSFSMTSKPSAPARSSGINGNSVTMNFSSTGVLDTTSVFGNTASSAARSTATGALSAVAPSTGAGQLSKAAIDAAVATSVIGSIFIALIAFCIFWRRHRRRNVVGNSQRPTSQSSSPFVNALPSFLAHPLTRLSSVHILSDRHSPPPPQVPHKTGCRDLAALSHSDPPPRQLPPKLYHPSTAVALSSNPVTPLYTVQRAPSGRLIAKPAPVAARLRGAADRLEALILRHDSSWYGGSQRSSVSTGRNNSRRSESAHGETDAGWKAWDSAEKVQTEKGALLNGFGLVMPAEQRGTAKRRAHFEGGASPSESPLKTREVQREREEEDCVSPLESDVGDMDRVSVISSDVPTEGREVV